MKRSRSHLLLNKSRNILKPYYTYDNCQNDLCEFTLSQLKHKKFLEKILNIIKTAQTELLTNLSDSKMNLKLSLKEIKDILENLKSQLNTTFEDNVKNKTNMEIKTNQNKLDLINDIFGKGKQNNNLKYENQKYTRELPHLRILNFKILNQLKYMDIKIKLISLKIISHKSSTKFIYLFLDGKNDTSQALNLLHDSLISIRKEFTLIVKAKEIQNLHLAQLQNNLISMKNKCLVKYRKHRSDYIETNQIINEESKEDYLTKTGIYTQENSNNENINQKYLIKFFEKNANNIYNKKLLSINDGI